MIHGLRSAPTAMMLSGHRSRTSRMKRPRPSTESTHPATATKNCGLVAMMTSWGRKAKKPVKIALIMKDR